MAQHNAIKFFEAKKVRTVWDDIEEKWIVAPVGVSFAKEEILAQVWFQEKFFRVSVKM